MTAAQDTLPATDMTGIHPALASALARQGYQTLTPVQVAVLAEEAQDKDLLVSAQTGSGKTVAFGMAIAPTLLADMGFAEAPVRPLGLIIAPTRELAMQVERELAWLYADAGVVMASCVGGMDMRKERRHLERGAHIVVGTPGRLRDHITKGSLDLAGLRAVVLDEADEMLDMGFREDLEFILAAAPEQRRTLMFSATVPKAIAHLAQTYQREAVRVVATAANERHADIDYQMVVVQSHERENAIINTLLYFDSGSAIVFCHTREAVKHLAARLGNRGFNVVSLSGELSQSERTNALQAMRDNRSRVCVATDVAARGIDLPNLDLVVHADVPTNPDTLLHRSGRTGRAGRKGVCVLIVPARRYAAAARVLDRANIQFAVRNAPVAAEIDARYREQILHAALAAAPADETESGFVADLLARMSPEQLAVIYLRQQLAGRPAPEDITDVPVPARTGSARAAPDAMARMPKGERRDMTGAAWFSLSVGRNKRAEPRWVLPLVCKAGGITRDDVGSIKILEDETRFQISAEKATQFAERIAREGSGEKGVTISPAGQHVAQNANQKNAGEPPREPSYKARTFERKHRPEDAGSRSHMPEAGAEKRPREASWKKDGSFKAKSGGKPGKPRPQDAPGRPSHPAEQRKLKKNKAGKKPGPRAK